MIGRLCHICFCACVSLLLSCDHVSLLGPYDDSSFVLSDELEWKIYQLTLTPWPDTIKCLTEDDCACHLIVPTVGSLAGMECTGENCETDWF